jgi:NAD dependent epimerase/dehydratase family enzyme
LWEKKCAAGKNAMNRDVLIRYSGDMVLGRKSGAMRGMHKQFDTYDKDKGRQRGGTKKKYVVLERIWKGDRTLCEY